MNISIQSLFLPLSDADESLAFYRDVLDFEVRNDVGYAGLRWITVGPKGQPDVNIVLNPPSGDASLSENELTVITELMAKGSFAAVILTSPDVDAAFEKIQAAGAEVIQEPMDQPYGVRDCAFRDPAGNTIRINQSA